MELVNRYFPDLDETKRAQLSRLLPLYQEWNAKINVVSRQDMDNLEVRHILHSLAIAKQFRFLPDADILDLGTGGGFPGIPLAIVFPETKFTLIDGTGKKIQVVREVAASLGLNNVKAMHARVEDLKTPGAFDFVVTRGVTTLDKLMVWSQRLLKKKHRHAYPNGLIALKGGHLQAEIKLLPGKAESYSELIPIRSFFDDPFFEEKYIVYVQG